MSGTDWPFGDLVPGKYGAILADPPWGFKTWSGPEKKVASRGTVAPYSTMEMEDIGGLPVADLAAPNCVLFMWFVWPTMPDALRLLEGWGFTYKTCAFSWMKADPYRLFALEEDVRMGLGYWTRANTEACLLAVRGKPRRRDNRVRAGDHCADPRALPPAAGQPSNAAREKVAHRLGASPGTLENLRRGRLKDISAYLYARLQAGVVTELEAELRHVQHELEIARQSGLDPRGGGVLSLVANEARLKTALGLSDGTETEKE